MSKIIFSTKEIKNFKTIQIYNELASGLLPIPNPSKIDLLMNI